MAFSVLNSVLRCKKVIYFKDNVIGGIKLAEKRTQRY